MCFEVLILITGANKFQFFRSIDTKLNEMHVDRVEVHEKVLKVFWGVLKRRKYFEIRLKSKKTI